jgi:hypothetical protein
LTCGQEDTGHEAEEKMTLPPTRLVQTAGEVLPDAVIELVWSASDDRPELLLWSGEKPIAGMLVEHAGTVYQPPALHPSVYRAMRLPSGPLDCGTREQLFTETRSLFEAHVGYSPPEAALLTAWNRTSWFADVLPRPPSVFIHGFDMNLR